MTDNVLAGELRKPVQMLADQKIGGQKSVHDDAEAERLGIKAGPIEGPTHFQQFVPLLAEIWGNDWFERGCLSVHFKNMVFEGEEVRAFVERPEGDSNRAKCWAEKADGTLVLEAEATLGPDDGETLLEKRMAALKPFGELIILEDVTIGTKSKADEPVIMGPDQHMGDLYPFTLNEKLAVITEPHEWYTGDSPWGGRVIPLEMVCVLGNYANKNAGFPIKRPCIGLFADLQMRMVDGPLMVDTKYILRREVVALSQTKRVENYWVKTQVFDETGTTLKAEILLNHGVWKASYPEYPKDLLPS